MEVRRRLDVATFAVATCETLRPLFVRWAADEARGIYERTMEALWSQLEGGVCDHASLLVPIEALPEYEYDDSDHRDFFVMLALGQLHDCVEVSRAGDSGVGSGALVDELDANTDHISRELRLGALRVDLQTAIHEGHGQQTTQAIRAIATQLSERVDSALAPAALRRRWPPDRVRRP